MTGKQTGLLFFAVLVAAWLQAALANSVSIMHTKPDFVLITLICYSIMVGTVGSALLNVWAGFLTAAIAGINYGSIMASRLITGALAGLLRQQVIEDSIIVPPITVFVGTWICSVVYFFMAPNLHTVRWWLHMVLVESLYNAVLAVPIYFALRALHLKSELLDGSNPFYEAH